MKNKGITLIALVITIIVLLILAGISIATLTGNNGILTQVDKAKTATTEGKVKELVSIAIGGLQTKNLGDTSKITPEAIAQEVNDNERRTDVSAESSTFPTYIIFEEEGMKVLVDVDLNIKEVEENKEKIENVYSVEDAENKIAPTDLFDYEVIDEAKVASITTESLPTKKIKITRIKPQYCNGGGYNPETNSNDFYDTNYEIDYNYEIKITDTLVIPYKVEYEGEMYRVTEVDISVDGGNGGNSIPNINTIIYPNTVTKIECNTSGNYDDDYKKINVNNVNTVVLPSKLKEIPYKFFANCINLKEINIPNSVTTIGYSAFNGCTGLTNITIPNSVTTIGNSAFYDTPWYDNQPDGVVYISNVLYTYKGDMPTNTEIVVPNNIVSISNSAFNGCTGLTNITIPNSVKTIGWGAFYECSNLTNIYCEATPQPSGWDTSWKGNCSATVHWGQTGPQ